MGTREEANEETIPLDVVAECILPSVSTKDLLRFRSVCKSWRQLIDDSYFIHKHLSLHDLTLHDRRPPFFTSIRDASRRHGLQVISFGWMNMPPSIYGMDIKCEDIVNGRINDDNEPAKILSLEYCPKGRGFNMLPPCKGLVLFASKSDPLCLCNPVTGEFAILPQTTAARYKFAYSYGFGFDAHRKQFKAVYIWDGIKASGSSYPVCECEVLSLGKDISWRQVGRLPFGHHFVCSSRSTPCHGSLHWIIRIGYLCKKNYSVLYAFDLTKEEFRRKALPAGLEEVFHLKLAEVEGNLVLMNHEAEVGLNVWVLEDYESNIWTKRHQISLESFPSGLSGMKHIRPWPLIIWEDKILLQFVLVSHMILYDSKQKTFQRVVVGDRKLSGRHLWYIYEQDPESALLISALCSR
ncbi:F-box/kelch-repeat protein At3g06240-like [Nymphaea colorata]|uniref:F-box/kelch-repeat protein At3g06240-like n=1 Tax=Nymphaea colorata TaxID=210225 RepID=UPI00129E5C03|nr:F-box/kelch-repeat protein At3g06240-like [Nymphaea colorata]